MPLHGGFVLLLLLSATSLVYSTLLFDQEGSGSFGSGEDIEGSGFSSGNGYVVDPYPEPLGDGCSNAATAAVTDAPFSPVDEGDAVLEGRCRSYCLENVLENETTPNDLINEDDFYATVSIDSLSSNCLIYQKVYECTAGCQMGGDSQECSENCFDRCVDDSSVYLPHSLCPYDCSKETCTLGCGAYQELKTLASKASEAAVPDSFSFTLQPYSSPYLHQPATYSVAFVATDDSSWLNNRSVTSFVVRVSTGDINTHYWLPNFESPLILGQPLSCKNVQVQFLPVDKYGPLVDSYIGNTTLTTYGDKWPDYPDHPFLYGAGLTVTTDTREGFWGHAIVNITWTNPTNAQFTTDFTVEVENSAESNCGRNVTLRNIEKTQYVWQATQPGDGPITGCTYLVKVLSNPHIASFPGPPKAVPLQVEGLTNPVPEGYIAPVGISCSLRDTQGDIVYLKPRIEWNLPTNPLLLKGIKEFQVRLSSISEEGISELLEQTTVNFDSTVLNKGQSQLIENNPHHKLLLQEFIIVYKPNSAHFLNSTHSCVHYVTSPKPVTDVIVKVARYDLPVLRLVSKWDKAVVTNGKVDRYHVCMGGVVLTNQSFADAVKTSVCRRTFTNSIEEEIDMNWFSLVGNDDIVWYIQVQAVSNVGLYSNWSIPRIFRPSTNDLVQPLDLNVSCSRFILPSFFASSFQLITLSVYWTYPPPGVDGLKNFSVLFSAVKRDGSVVGHRTDKIALEDSNRYSHGIDLTPINSYSGYDYFQLQILPVYSDGYGILNQEPQTCILDGSPFPPSEIPSVELAHFHINQYGRLNVSMSWEQPKVTNGGIRMYRLYIGPNELSGKGQPEEYVLLTEILINYYHEPGVSVASNLLDVFGNLSLWEFYIQVLPVNNVLATSVWTTPIFVSMESMELQEEPVVTILSSEILTTPTSTTPTESKEPTEAVDNNSYQQLLPVMSAIIPVIFVVGLGIVLVVVLLGVAYCQRRNLNNKGPKRENSVLISMGKPLVSTCGWERHPSDVEKLSLIGEGTFGEVYKGILHQGPDMKSKRTAYIEDSLFVIIATLRATSSEDERYEFINIMEKYKQLSEVDHPFFLPFKGCVTSSLPCYIITEYPDNGNLLTFLQNHKKRLSDTSVDSQLISSPYEGFQSHPTHQNLYPIDLLNFSRQIASAMDCLAGLGRVHKDIACRNIYLDQFFNLKLSELGVVTSSHREMVYVDGKPLRWCAPEVLKGHTHSSLSDVWAFGVTVWEIITLGEFPYQDIHNEDLLGMIATGKRLPKPRNCSEEFFLTLLSCWERNARKRPSFESLHETFLNHLSKSETASLVTLDVVSQKPHPLSDNTLMQGTTSPTNSSDSAIIEDNEMGVAVMSTRPGIPDHMRPSGGFSNPGFRRFSTKSVNLDSFKFGTASTNPTQTSIKISATTTTTATSNESIDTATEV